MKKGKSKDNSNLLVWIIVVIAVVVALYFVVNSLSGNVVYSQYTEGCVDSDADRAAPDGINVAKKGFVTKGYSTLRDYCHPRKNSVVEYYCSGEDIRSVEIACSNGCNRDRCS